MPQGIPCRESATEWRIESLSPGPSNRRGYRHYVGEDLQFVGWGIALLVGIGCALMFAPSYWGRLVACFLFAVSGTWAGAAIGMWSRNVAGSNSRSRLKLVSVSAADLLLTVGLIWFAFPRAEAQGPAAPQVTITGGDNVVSVGQVGGITAREVTINNPATRPEFRVLGRKDVTNSDGTHTVSIIGAVASPIAPGLLSLQIHASGMRDANVMAAPVGGISMTNLRNVRKEPGLYSAEIPSPRGEYIITVVTAGMSDVKLSASF